MKKIEKNGTRINVIEEDKSTMKIPNLDLNVKNILDNGESVKKMDLQTGMTRNVPSANNSLLFFLNIGGKKSKITPDNYVKEYEKFMVKRELSIEKWLLDTFSHLGINATVKSDRYSLPIMYQIKVTQYGESYLNGAFETFQLFRKVLTTVLNEDPFPWKLRFYVFAEIEDSFPMGKVNYYFNYYYK